MYLFWVYYIIGNYNIMLTFIKNTIYTFFFNLNNTIKFSLKNNHNVDVSSKRLNNFDHHFFVNVRF